MRSVRIVQTRNLETLRHMYIGERRSIRQISASVGITRWAVTTLLREAGVQLRPPGRPFSGVRGPTDELPGPTMLQRLYVMEGWSTTQIAAAVDLSRQKVAELLRAAGVQVRPACTGLRHWGLPVPSRDDLERYIEKEHLSYAKIGRLYGITSSAAGSWVRRYGLRPDRWAAKRGAAPYIPTSDELADLYALGCTLAEIGQKYGLSEPYIRGLFRRYGLAVRPSGWFGLPRLTCDDGHRVRSSYELRVDNWLRAHGVAHVYEPQIPVDRRYTADFIANGWYIEIWGVSRARGKGGRDLFATYRARRAKKLELYAAMGSHLIELHSWTFSMRVNSWERLVSRCLHAPEDPPLICERSSPYRSDVSGGVAPRAGYRAA